jgi:hypothetical protein
MFKEVSLAKGENIYIRGWRLIEKARRGKVEYQEEYCGLYPRAFHPSIQTCQRIRFE